MPQTLNWKELSPQWKGEDFDTSKSYSYLSLQPRIQQAYKQLLKADAGAILIVKGGDTRAHWQTVKDFYSENLEKPAIKNYYQISTLDVPDSNVSNSAKIKVNLLLSEKNLANNSILLENLNAHSLFGSYYFSQNTNKLYINSGIIHQLHGSILAVSAQQLVQNPTLWKRLKLTLESQRAVWEADDAEKDIYLDIPPMPLDFKLIILGDIEQLTEFIELEPEIYQQAYYSEFHNDIAMQDKQAHERWAIFVSSIAKSYGFAGIDNEAINYLYQYYVRLSENIARISLQPDNLQHIFATLKNNYPELSNLVSEVGSKRRVNKMMLTDYFTEKNWQVDHMQKLSEEDILQEHVLIDTTGMKIAQINGLSVVEYDGVPISYGEPSRISCTVQLGEGEINDIERKNELAGNIHAKATMLVEACLANILELPSQLPFSASIAFEQSYSDIDGDSASLALFSVLVSALAKVELNQGIAVTGAIDQFGRLQSVGGINLKIEGFFNLCRQRGLTGKQGVIIPESLASHLSLSEEVVEAVKQSKFSIWAVKDVFEALPIMTGREWDNQNSETEKSGIKQLILERLDIVSELSSESIFCRFLKLFSSQK